jgi:hypothetical protein
METNELNNQQGDSSLTEEQNQNGQNEPQNSFTYSAMVSKPNPYTYPQDSFKE